MKIHTACISFFLLLFFSTLAVIIWATIFDLPLLPGVVVGLLGGGFIGIWYCRTVTKAKKSRQTDWRECVNMTTTRLSLVLFVNLFATMLVWAFTELF